MPVVVTGASGFIGPHAVRGFAAVSPEVRAYIRRREAAPALREAGAKVAVGWVEDVDTLGAVMDGAHTVCHLTGSLNAPDDGAYDEANHRSTAAVVRAARAALVRRLLYLSCPGADPGSTNAYLRTKGLAEEEVSRSGLEHVIIRSAHVYGPGSPWLDTVRRLAAGTPARVLGSGRQVLAPAFVRDVVAMLVAADDRERVESGVWGLDGPDRVTADELCDVLAGSRRRLKVHLTNPRTAGLVRFAGRPLSSAAFEVLAADSVSDHPSAPEAFGIARTGLADGLALAAGPSKGPR